MRLYAARPRRSLLFLAVAACLMAAPACYSTVTVGRSAPLDKKVPAKVYEEKKPAQKPPDKKPEKTEPEKTETVPEQKKPAAAQSVPQAVPPAPVEKKEGPGKVSPQSSPARPRAAVESGKSKDAASPYKLDLSIGGFGLGVGLFDTPVGVAVDDQENIYVVDQGNFRIQKFDRYGIFQFAFGRQGMGDGEFVEENVDGKPTLRETGEFEFNKPVGIFLDVDDTRNLLRITVVDSLNYRIRRFLLTRNPGDRFPDDVFVELVKFDGDKPDTAMRDKYSAESRQVILDPIYLNEPSGKANKVLLAPFVWGGLGFTEGQTNLPTCLTMDNGGILYVSDTGNSRVQGFYVTANNTSTDATFFREWGNDLDLPYGAGRLNEPTAIAFDNSGFGGFLVLDKLKDGSYNIQRFDKDGKFVNVLASSGDKEGQFRQPVGIAVNPFDNTVFVTDRARKKVMVYSNTGEFLFAFGGEELADPRDIAVLRNNYIYVTDAVKNMVYRYVPQ